MTPAERLEAVKEMLASAMLAQPCHPEAVIKRLETASPNFADKLAAEPKRTANVRTAIERACRAHNAWIREGKPCPLPDRLAPSARQLQAAMR